LRNNKHLLWEIPEAAVAKYNKISPELRLPFHPRAVACVLNSYVIDEARRKFEGVRDSRFMSTNGTTYHFLKGCVLWYKQLGPDGLPSNYPTDTAIEMMQGSFPWMPQKVLLVVGFEIDDTCQRLLSVVIQRFNSAGRVQFYIEILPVVSKARILAMPTVAAQEGQKVRVRIKRGPEQKELLVQENE
jgi:hypothetical protein